MKIGLKKHQQQSIPAVVTIEFRVQKRNLIADLIQANSVLKEINEQIIMMRVKEIENNIYQEHSANIHLYSSKIEKVISLFKGINQNGYLYIAQKLRKCELDVKSIFKLLQKKKQLKDYDQSIQNKQTQVKKFEYDPLNTNTKQNIPKIVPNSLVTNKVTITKAKPTNPAFTLISKPYLIFADPVEQKEPIPEKKVKIQQDSEDEIDIRVNDGMQGAALIGVFCSKQVTLYDSKIKIPVYLLVGSLPQYRVLCEKIDFSKLHAAKDTINFLSLNQERKIVFGQVILKPCEYASQLKELSENMLKQEKIIAQKYDNGNATFIILHRNQLEQVLKARKQSLSFDAADMVIKEWAKQQSYIEWWALNKENHFLHFLISYKNQTIITEHSFERITLQKPSCYPKIQQIIDQQLKKKDIDDLLQGFLSTDILQQQMFTISAPEIEQNNNPEINQPSSQVVSQQLNLDDLQLNGIDEADDLPDFPIQQIEIPIEQSQKDTDRGKFNIKISNLTLQLKKEDYF